MAHLPILHNLGIKWQLQRVKAWSTRTSSYQTLRYDHWYYYSIVVHTVVACNHKIKQRHFLQFRHVQLSLSLFYRRIPVIKLPSLEIFSILLNVMLTLFSLG